MYFGNGSVDTGEYSGRKAISKPFTKHGCQHVIESRDKSATLQIQDFLRHSGAPMLLGIPQSVDYSKKDGSKAIDPQKYKVVVISSAESCY